MPMYRFNLQGRRAPVNMTRITFKVFDVHIREKRELISLDLRLNERVQPEC